MGIIAAATAAPASKFVNPKNLDVRAELAHLDRRLAPDLAPLLWLKQVIAPNQDFTIEMAINNVRFFPSATSSPSCTLTLAPIPVQLETGNFAS